VPLVLFVEHSTIVIATLLSDIYRLAEECFETLEELEANKRHLNNKAAINVRLASQFVRCIQIQTNEYARSIEKGRRVKYPSFSDLVSTIIMVQFLAPPLPQKVDDQFFPVPQAHQHLLASTVGVHAGIPHHPLTHEPEAQRLVITRAHTNCGKL